MNTLQAATSPLAELRIALQGQKAINAQPSQLEYVLAQAMAKAFADMGLKADERADEINYLVKTMPAEVCRHLPGIKLTEIPLAINRGVLRAFGDFYGLNVATFMHFLSSHYHSSARAEAIRQQQTPALPAAPNQPSPAELAQMRRNRIITAFEQYKTTGGYTDYGSLVFDMLNEMGKIPFDEQREAQIWQQANQNLKARYSRVSVYPDERAKLRESLNQLLSGDAQGKILTEAKRIALFELFDDLILSGTDIGEWLTLDERVKSKE